MAVVTLSARQRKPGETITVRAVVSLQTPEEVSDNYDAGVGVKVGATAPTNVSEFAAINRHYDETPGRASILTRYAYVNGVRVAALYSSTFFESIAASGTHAPGRYLFAFAEVADGVIQVLSTPYLIT